MNKKLFLTSIVALGFACPAMAVTTVDGFPASKIAEENHIYRGAAIYDNMGAYGGRIVADPLYVNNTYNLNPGQYLQTSGEPANCTDGYYCPGGEGTYNETTPQGINNCPTGYGHSDTNATAASQCYTSCDSGFLPNSTGATGNAYYGIGWGACAVTSCDTGYHVDSSAAAYAGAALYNQVGSADALDSAVMPFGSYHLSEYNSSGQKPYLSQLPCNPSEDSGCSVDWKEYAIKYYNLHDGEWAVHFDTSTQSYAMDAVEKVRGKARFSSVTSEDSAAPAMLTTSQLGSGTGNNCYCNIIAFQSVGHWYDILSPWVYAGTIGSGDIEACFNLCAEKVGNNSYTEFRSALLGSASGTVCVINKYSITWNGATNEQITDNKAADDIPYGGDIRTPSGYDSTQVPAGKKFVGWEFSVPESNHYKPQQ